MENESGERLKNLRIEKKLTLRDLSQITGISKATLSRYENGDILNAPFDKIQTLAKALNTTPQYILGDVDGIETSVLDNYYFFNKELKETDNIPGIYHYLYKEKDIYDKINKYKYLRVLEEIEKRQNKIKTMYDKLLGINLEGLSHVEKFIDFIIYDGSYSDSYSSKINELLHIILQNKKEDD